MGPHKDCCAIVVNIHFLSRTTHHFCKLYEADISEFPLIWLN